MTAPRLCWAGLVRLAAVVGIVAGCAVVLMPVVVPRAAAGEPGATPFVRVRIDRVTPDVVTTTSPPVVSISGTVINIGDRPVHDVKVRLERAAPVTSSAGLRTSLDGGTNQYQPAATFLAVAAKLQRGQEARFVLTAPLRAVAKPPEGPTRPGIYPVLVNVNGTPDYGVRARLDNARFLLPVIGVPPTTGDPASAVAPDTSNPVGITMLWPLADRPRLFAVASGGVGIPARLTDDDIANSLTTGGRLDNLLSAAEAATSYDADPGGAVGRAICLAVDPDLLVTVNAMTSGYVVSNSPSAAAQRAGGATHPGTGQAAAVVWLNRLRALARHMCVTPLPYAQADLDALQRVDDRGLSAVATIRGGDVIDHILGTQSTRGAALLPDGPLTSRVVDLLSVNRTVAIAAADLATQHPGSEPSTAVDTTPRSLSPQVLAVRFDPAVGAALAGMGPNPAVPSYLDTSLTVRLQHDSDSARRQDAVSSVYWRALQPDAVPRRQIMLPPATWNPRAEDAQAVLTALATTIHGGLAVPRPLPELIAETTAGDTPPEPTGAYSLTRGRFSDDLTTAVAGELDRLRGLTAALTTDQRTGLTGAQYTEPLRENMLRVLSQSDPPDSRNGEAQQRLSVVNKLIDDLFGSVTVVNPGGSYTLASELSPLPLVLHNGLGVPIRVRLQVGAPPGVRVTDVGQIELPPGYLPLRVPIEVHFTQRVAIDVALRTTDGMPLGGPVRLSVHSNAYGKVLFAITLTAAAVLVALAGRRLWHRFRGQPDPADLDRPDPPHAPAIRSPDAIDERVDEEYRV